MADKAPIHSSGSLQRSRNSRAPEDSRNLRETGGHVPKHFPDTAPDPALEGPTEKAPDKAFGLARKKANPGEPGGNRN